MEVPVVLDWIGQGIGTELSVMLWLLALSLLISAVGFYRVVYFVSIGYAFAIVAMAIAAAVGMRQHLTWASILQHVFLVLWGLRLGTYLVRRESRTGYRREREASYQRSSEMSLVRKCAIWIAVSALYVAMYSPSLFGLVATPSAPAWLTRVTQIVGLATMAGGLILETVADKQKSDYKARQPTRFCDVGLYRWVRCPNYLGEIAIWLGSWIAGITFYTSGLHWFIALIGLVCIVLIMLGSTKRLERSQAERYGSLPEYQEYVRSVPVLLPFVPVYTLKNVPVILE